MKEKDFLPNKHANSIIGSKEIKNYVDQEIVSIKKIIDKEVCFFTRTIRCLISMSLFTLFLIFYNDYKFQSVGNIGFAELEKLLKEYKDLSLSQEKEINLLRTELDLLKIGNE